MASGLWCGGCPDAAYFKTLSEASGQSLFSCGVSRLFRRTFYRMVPRPSFPPALLGLSRLSTAAWRLYLSLFCTGIRHRRCALGLCVCADCLPFMEKNASTPATHFSYAADTGISF
jgi:hypothetical protein